MSFFGDLFKRPAATPPVDIDLQLRDALVKFLLSVIRDKGGRIHVEDAISAAATIVGERCIDATGDFPLRSHNLPPGSRFFSTSANTLICGDLADVEVKDVPRDAIVGRLHSLLAPQVYSDADFPSLKAVFEHYAASIGNPADWGKVPLSVPSTHHPFAPPLRIGYETRDRVDQLLQPIGTDKARCLRIATEGLAEILRQVAHAIDHKIALSLAIETINGMAKTAPMTSGAMKAA